MRLDLFINDIVVSGYLYYILAFNSEVSPKTLQRKGKIQQAIESEFEIINALNNFTFLSGNQSFLSEVPQLMAKYNLLPNDATILATCKLHGLKLASHDSDFIFPCREENIELLRDDSDS